MAGAGRRRRLPAAHPADAPGRATRAGRAARRPRWCRTRAAGSAPGSSDVLLYLFGWSAFWWAGLCLYAVARGYRRLETGAAAEPRPLWVSILGFGLLLVASAALESLRLARPGPQPAAGAGGIIGTVLAQLSSGLARLHRRDAAARWPRSPSAGACSAASPGCAIAEVTGFLLESAYALALRRLGAPPRPQRSACRRAWSAKPWSQAETQARRGPPADA